MYLFKTNHNKIKKRISQHSLQWRHNGRNSVSNHQPHDGLFNRLFRRRSTKTSKLRVTGLCAGTSPESEFPAQMVSNAEGVSIWWRHHVWQAVNNDDWPNQKIYELLTQRAPQDSLLYNNGNFQCMGKIFCVGFQRYPLKLDAKHLTHKLKYVFFIEVWKSKSYWI